MPSELGYWELNEMPGISGCLRQGKPIDYLRWVINFWISDVKQYRKTMTHKQSQNERGEVKSIRSHTQIARVL